MQANTKVIAGNKFPMVEVMLAEVPFMPKKNMF